MISARFSLDIVENVIVSGDGVPTVWDQHLIYCCICLLAHNNVVLKANVKIGRLATCDGASINEQLVHLDVEPQTTPS